MAKKEAAAAAAQAPGAAAAAADTSFGGQARVDARERRWSGPNDGVYTTFILILICILAFSCRLFAVVRFESVIHEFDPWFNFRVTRYLVKEGFYNFHNWFDETTWYPLGRFIGGTLYPGLMWTSASLYHLLHTLNMPVDIRNVSVMLAPLMAAKTAVVTYLLTKETWNSAAGLVAAIFMALTPGYTSRSVAGSYDNEAVAIFALVATFYLWVKSVKTGSMLWGALCAVAYYYMVASWGGYIFIINLIPMHAVALLVTGRYSHRLYVAYCTFFVLGTLMSMTVSFVSFIPVTSPEHMPSIGVFGLLQLYSFFFYVKGHVSKEHMRYLILAAAACAAGLAALFVVGSVLGYFPMLTGRLLALLGSTSNIAIVKSVSEHQPSAWTTFFFDFAVQTVFCAVGLFYAFQRMTDATLFAAMYILTSSYFAGIMVRLVLVQSPAICVLAGIGVSETYRRFFDLITAGEGVVPSDDDGDAFDAAAEEAAAASAAAAPAAASDDEGDDDEDDGDEDDAGARRRGGAAGKKKGKPQKAKLEDKIARAQRKRRAEARPQGVDALLGGRVAANPVSGAVAWVVVAVVLVLMCYWVIHCTWVTSVAYSSPSVVLQARNADGSKTVFDDFREAYYWLAKNTADDAKIMSWWDYGYQIKGMGNRSVIVDNNTRNNTHIAMVGLAMASTEEMAYPILRQLDVDYILVVFGGKIGYSSDDINKFLWMVRISGGIFPRIVESDFYSSSGQYRIDAEASSTMKNCMMYKMCYHRFGEVTTEWGQPGGFDRVRRAVVGAPNIKFKYLDEALTTSHWMVRIYKVRKDADDIGGADFPSYKVSAKAARRTKRLADAKKDKKKRKKKKKKQQSE